MRVSGLFGGLLMLFMLIRGSEDVSVTCGQHWLQSRLKPRPSLTQKAQHHEICLGTGCPATGGTSDFFEFLYPLSSRGTRVEECPWGILIESSITYVPTNLNITGYLPISWYTQR
ncbi:oocyte-secreted protein 4A [Canis lupus dingo]|uniref:oocyte-secreted protein 4A n=1 Tax=Canis lupus dingo TaxID=286419 RepID=UPI0020C46E5D|nr:oocyte-secreted protein 4A [Canis lupus dingo]